MGSSLFSDAEDSIERSDDITCYQMNDGRYCVRIVHDSDSEYFCEPGLDEETITVYFDAEGRVVEISIEGNSNGV